MKKASKNVTGAIGNTPVVCLDRFTDYFKVSGKIFAKLEYLNPGFSKKDRIAKQIIEEAEKKGALDKKKPVLEMTSGNTGIGLAVVCAAKGYDFIAVMSKGNSPERAEMIVSLGAEVVLVDQAPGGIPGQVTGEDLALVEKEVENIVQKRDVFFCGQFDHEGNTRAHEIYTGEELWEQTSGEIDVFVDFAGTAGSFTGCARALQKHDKKIRCYLVEPKGAAYLSGQTVTRDGHKIQGGGYAKELPLLEKERVCDYLQVDDDDVITMTRMAARLEGIFSGYSSGANLAAALQLLQGKEEGKSIALLMNDTGLKYLSTDLFKHPPDQR